MFTFELLRGATLIPSFGRLHRGPKVEHSPPNSVNVCVGQYQTLQNHGAGLVG